MDLSKAFDTLNHDLLIAKLHAYGFSEESLQLIKGYLTSRWQRTKVNASFSNWTEILLEVPEGSVLGPLLFNIPYQGKKVGKIFVGEKFSYFRKISHFSPTNFSNSSLFSDQFLKLKGLSWVGLLFFQRKVVLLVWDFSNWAWRSALLVSLIHGIGCCKYTPSWISQNKKFLYKLIFRDYKIFKRIPEEF